MMIATRKDNTVTITEQESEIEGASDVCSNETISTVNIIEMA